MGTHIEIEKFVAIRKMLKDIPIENREYIIDVIDKLNNRVRTLESGIGNAIYQLESSLK